MGEKLKQQLKFQKVKLVWTMLDVIAFSVDAQRYQNDSLPCRSVFELIAQTAWLILHFIILVLVGLTLHATLLQRYS